MDADVRVLTDDGEIFAKIEAVFQVGDARLALPDYIQRSGDFSHCAKRSSPMRVRTVQRSSNRLPLPNRSRSDA